MTRYGLQPVTGQSALRGFRPLLRKELDSWWGGRRWIVQALLWQLVINGLLVTVLFVLPQIAPAEFAETDPLQGFFSLGSLALAIGVIVMAQDAFTTELQSGTAEWLLAKPVARPAFILSKLVAHGIGMLVVLIALPGAVALVLLSLAGPVDIPALLAGLAVMALHTFFYLCLTLMMGILSHSRGIILAVPLGVLLGGTLFLTLLATLPFNQLLLLTPWPLADVASALGSGASLPWELLLPIIATGVWAAVFIVVALWRFERLEI